MEWTFIRLKTLSSYPAIPTFNMFCRPMAGRILIVMSRIIMSPSPFLQTLPKHSVSLRVLWKVLTNIKELEWKVGYSYRQVLGEIIYTYVVCHVDISYAAMFPSHFAQAPAEEDYKALKDVVKYLCCTMDWGLMYWHKMLPCYPYQW
jgi:hypothetical protein